MSFKGYYGTVNPLTVGRRYYGSSYDEKYAKRQALYPNAFGNGVNKKPDPEKGIELDFYQSNEAIAQHIAYCLSQDQSPKSAAYLGKFLENGESAQNDYFERLSKQEHGEMPLYQDLGSAVVDRTDEVDADKMLETMGASDGVRSAAKNDIATREALLSAPLRGEVQYKDGVVSSRIGAMSEEHAKLAHAEKDPNALYGVNAFGGDSFKDAKFDSRSMGRGLAEQIYDRADNHEGELVDLGFYNRYEKIGS